MSVVQEIDKLVGPSLVAEGVELVHTEYQREPQGWVLRFYLDKEGGFSLEDCTAWNDRLGTLLEGNSLIPHAFRLEISSPGLNRPLKKTSDFLRFQGQDAEVKLYAAQNGQKNFHGRISGVENNDLILEDRTSGVVRIPIDSVAKARLDPPIDFKKDKEGD